MQSVLVNALAMRQLGRLNPRHLMAAGYSLAGADWCPRTIHTRQLWGCCSAVPLGCPRGRDATRSWSLQQLRFKSSKKRNAAKATREEQEEEEEERDPEDSDYEDKEEEEEDDPNVRRDYKDVTKHVQSFRYDIIMRGGLDVARNKIEDAFYSNKLRLNGRSLTKKSKSVRVGDTLDFVLSENPDRDTVSVMRVVFRSVLSQSEETDKQQVQLRRWKSLDVPRDDVFKP